MKTPNAYIKVAVSLLAAAILTATSGRADTYSWTNYQSDIAGVAHTDPNLINPWGMAVGSSGTIWVSSRRSCAQMARRFNLTACGICSRSATACISPLGSPTNRMASLASSPRTKIIEREYWERTHPCLPFTRSCPGKGVRSPFQRVPIQISDV